MYNEVDCPDCEGVGILEDKKGNEYPCPGCKGKGKIDAKLLKKDSSKESEK